MERDEKVNAGVIGVLTLILGGIGGYVYFDDATLDNMYVCTADERVGVFDEVTPEGVVGSYKDETGAQQYGICFGGIWQPIRDYAKDNDIDISKLLAKPQNEQVVTTPALEWDCNNKECVPK